ncbi:MAG TPA: O-antigen ligase family protein [Candidatus Polarisedimenticolia bacterium]|nr:O-antigen ligase family protein [Candidatus Polarisedimenticolia bacterium]
MNPGSQKPIRLAMGALGLVAIMMMAFALIALNLAPSLILLLTVAGIALPILILRPEAGLHLFIVITLFESYGQAEQTFTIGKMGGVIIMGSWLLSVAVSRRIDLRLNGQILTMVFFLAWSGLSILVASDNNVAVRQTLTYLQLMLAMLMFGSVVKSLAALQRLLRTLVTAITLAAVHGLYMYASGQAPTTAGIVINRNGMAVYLTVAIACAYILYQVSQHGLERLALMIALPIQFVALALTYSRAGIIGLGVVVALVGYRLARQSGYLILGATAAMALVIAIGLPTAFYKRVESIGSSVKNQEDTFGQRVELAGAGVRMISAHPFLGVGAGNFGIVLPRYGRGGYLLGGHWASHNTYVGLAAESGVLALALFLGCLYFAFKDLRAVVRAGDQADPRLALLAIAVEVSIVAFLVSGLSGNHEKTKYFYLFLGLVLSLDGIRRRMPAPAPAAEADPDAVDLASPVAVVR